MKKILFIALVVTLAAATYAPADSPGKTKIIVGSILLGSGLALGTAAIADFCLSECSRQDAEFVAGIALIGVGTTYLIWGLIQRSHAHNQSLMPVEPPRYLVGISPTRGGVAGAFVIRW